MRRTPARPPTRTGVRAARLAVTLAVALGAAALTGCSSSDSSAGKPTAAATTATTTAPATTTAAPHVDGHLDYTGSSNGGADFTGGVKCELAGGRLIGVTSPDTDLKSLTKATPKFIAAIAPSQVAMLVTPDKADYSSDGNSKGLSGRKSGGTWTVTVSNLKIGSITSSASVTVNGSLTCTSFMGK
jgi:hypothetical protein